MKYPKGEIVWVSYYNNKSELKFIITSKSAREYYLLYEAVGEEFKKLGKSKDPKELEEKFKIEDKLSR